MPAEPSMMSVVPFQLTPSAPPAGFARASSSDTTLRAPSRYFALPVALPVSASTKPSPARPL